MSRGAKMPDAKFQEKEEKRKTEGETRHDAIHKSRVRGMDLRGLAWGRSLDQRRNDGGRPKYGERTRVQTQRLNAVRKARGKPKVMEGPRGSTT